jgi:predicted lipoprotein with Yx(FWY)xxD motif
MKRVLMLATVALVMAALLVAMAMPALAAKPAPTKDECHQTLLTLRHGQKLSGQEKQLVRQYLNQGQCVKDSSG